MRNARNRIVREAILRGHAEGTDPVEILEPYAQKLKDMALDGDLGALKEVFDRVDGKPAQEFIADEDQLEESLEAVLERISEKRKLALSAPQQTETLPAGRVLDMDPAE